MRIAIALSGGIDSMVAAQLLKEQGHNVYGIYMHLWNSSNDLNNNEQEYENAIKASETVGIPLETVDFSKEFKQEVVDCFIQELAKGKTPNPCVICNKLIKWGRLLDHALNLGADLLATGHYARLIRDDFGKYMLYKGIDKSKDQSYVLSTLKDIVLSHMCLPLGTLTKISVREIAKSIGLNTDQIRESQDLCFLAKSRQDEFLREYAPEILHPGPIINLDGLVIGEHRGLPLYTIGQRKGLGIAAEQPYFVKEKSIERNELIVSFLDHLPKFALVAKEANWIGSFLPDPTERYQIKIRYKAKPVLGRIRVCQNSLFTVQFDEGLRDITPGQIVVVYNGDRCLGSGEIVRAESIENISEVN